MRARLAEVRVGLKKHAAAKPVLEALAREDLMPDADAWVALAQAREAASDVKGALVAVATALQRAPRHAGALALKKSLQAAPRPAASPEAQATALKPAG